VLLFALSSSHKLGLALVALVFTGFSLTVSMVVPRFRPQFPGRRGLPAFVGVSALLFVAMISAVLVFGKESKSATTEGKKVHVTEVEYKIELPKTTFSPGTYTFEVSNKGRIVHNLNVQGGGSTESSQDIQPDSTGTVAAELKTGNYTLYCSIPGHRQQGMQQKITVS
jgi:plastocyanin